MALTQSQLRQDRGMLIDGGLRIYTAKTRTEKDRSDTSVDQHVGSTAMEG